jgi:hypothetical protein
VLCPRGKSISLSHMCILDLVQRAFIKRPTLSLDAANIGPLIKQMDTKSISNTLPRACIGQQRILAKCTRALTHSRPSTTCTYIIYSSARVCFRCGGASDGDHRTAGHQCAGPAVHFSPQKEVSIVERVCVYSICHLI